MKKIYFHQQIGNIELVSNKKCSGIRYSISPRSAKISFNPVFADKILPIDEEKVLWFLKNREKFSKIPRLEYNADSQIETFTFNVMFRAEKKLTTFLSAKLEKNILTIFYPEDFHFRETNSQNAIKNIITHFFRIEAKKVLPQRVENIAKKWSFKYSDVKISTSKTRWGSCNSKGDISLSTNLMFLSEQLIDFVIAHELCHTIYMNHSKKYYSELQKIYPNHQTLNNELKKKGKYFL